MSDKIYIVTDGEYSDYSIKGIFSTEKMAQDVKEFYKYDDIEEWNLDEIPGALNYFKSTGLKRYSIAMDRSGSTLEVNHRPDDNTKIIKSDFFITSRGAEPVIIGTVFAKDEQHAVKITNEKRAQFIAENAWIEGATL